MSTIECTFDLHDLRELIAAGDAGGVVAMIRDAVGRGIVTHVTDGFSAGDRGALQLTCTYPTGEQVVENALVEIRDGRIVRWSGVQAWDD